MIPPGSAAVRVETVPRTQRLGLRPGPINARPTREANSLNLATVERRPPPRPRGAGARTDRTRRPDRAESPTPAGTPGSRFTARARELPAAGGSRGARPPPGRVTVTSVPRLTGSLGAGPRDSGNTYSRFH
eukprot:766206-Hanusia_phi.AAC.4